MTNPLYTSDQEAAEKLSLRLIERADVRAARGPVAVDERVDPRIA